MNERVTDSSPAFPAGRTSDFAAGGLSLSELVLGALALLWLPGAWLWLSQGPAPAPVTGAVVALLLAPSLLLAGLAFGLRRMRQLREEADGLRQALDAVRLAQIQQKQAGAAVRTASPSPLAPPLAPPLRSRSEPAVAAPAAAAPAALQPASEPQSSLAFDPQPGPAPAPLHADEFVRALNFPDSSEDVEGIRCLRLALEDREAARLIRSAQDVLTLLAQDGIFMDDLHPDPARPELWRRFAHGERGKSMADLGGVHDRSSLALTGGRMRSDAVFRDAAHHFLRQFDRSLQAFEQTASDQDLMELSETRTVKAFMLFSRVAGVFD